MELYFHPAPAASRSVLLTLKAVGLEPKMKEINLFAKEQLRPEFVKLNPQHTIPTIVDNGFVIWESRAIMIYLAEKYGKNDFLYPKDPQTRAIVNQRLFFDMGTLYENFSIFFRAKLARESQECVEEKKKGMEAGVELLNTFLDGNKYAAGNTLTLADLALVSSISTYELFDVDFNRFPNVMRWYELCQETILRCELGRNHCFQTMVDVNEIISPSPTSKQVFATHSPRFMQFHTKFNIISYLIICGNE